MKKVVLLSVMLMMVSLGNAVDVSEYEKIEDLEARDIVRQADTFVFYSPKVGDVITLENIEYTVLSDMTLKVTKVETNAIGTDGVLNILEKVGEGINVVRETLVIIQMDLPVTVMGERVMENREDVIEVRMPSVKVVEEYAFYLCNGLTNVIMPEVQTVGGDAFDRCKVLKNVSMQKFETIGEWAFLDCDALTSVEMPVVKTVGKDAFNDCLSLTIMSLPVVKTVGVSAFNSCYALTNVQMPLAGCCFQNDSFTGCVWKPENNGVTSSCP